MIASYLNSISYLKGEGEFNVTYADEKVAHNKVLKAFRELIRLETKKKIRV